jgi:hypothetical protein
MQLSDRHYETRLTRGHNVQLCGLYYICPFQRTLVLSEVETVLVTCPEVSCRVGDSVLQAVRLVVSHAVLMEAAMRI